MQPGSEAKVAQAYMRLIDSANAFDLEDALDARDALYEQHGELVERIGISDQLESLDALGVPFSQRTIDWWQGARPDKDERFLIVWWHPSQSASRSVVLGAQAIGERYDIPVVAMVPDGIMLDRRSAAEVVAICPSVTFAAAPSRSIEAADLSILPQLTVVEEGRVVWQGTWQQLSFTPLAP
jgi:hypothetical protein